MKKINYKLKKNTTNLKVSILYKSEILKDAINSLKNKKKSSLITKNVKSVHYLFNFFFKHKINCLIYKGFIYNATPFKLVPLRHLNSIEKTSFFINIYNYILLSVSCKLNSIQQVNKKPFFLFLF